MGLEIRIIRGGILLEAWGLHDVFEHTTYIAVDIFNIELATLDTLDNLFNLCGLSRLHEVVASVYLTNRRQAFANTNPVGHHDAFITPILTQNLCEQVVIAHRILTIYLVIRGHDGPRVALANSNLKTTQVKFTGGTLRQALIDSGTIGFLRVDSKMLGRYACALTLYTLDIGCCYLTGKQWVFGIILEVTATERITMQVHARTENHVATVFLGLVSDGLTYLAHQLRIPCRSETRADREGCGIIGLIGALARGVDTYTSRTVGQHGSRDAKAGYCGRGSCGACHEVGLTAYNGIGREEVVSTSHKEFCFLLKGHRFQYLVDIIGAELGLSICCHNECSCK